jgi:uncharacterized membrane protein YhaH (DUF805 family)
MVQDVQPSAVKSLTGHARGMIGLLIAEYLLGVVTNLYVQFPAGQNESGLWAFSRGQSLILLHILVGILLLFGTIALLARARKNRDSVWSFAAVVALCAVLLAMVTGLLFVGSQLALYSLLMSLSFITALLAYFYGLYASRSHL